jgi:hypothetical protein
MHRILGIALSLALFACDSNPENRLYVIASEELTMRYTRTPVEIRATAAGGDCLVLLVQSKTPLNDNTVEALHYGSPDYKGYPGGVRQFAIDHEFRGVAYRDAHGTLWTFGSTSEKEAREVHQCD